MQTSVHYITAVIISKVLCDADRQEEESQNKRLHYILSFSSKIHISSHRKNIEKTNLGHHLQWIGTQMKETVQSRTN